MNDNSKHPRRWFQFSLRTLLFLIVLAAVAAFALKENVERRRLESEYSELKGDVISDWTEAGFLHVVRKLPNSPTAPVE